MNNRGEIKLKNFKEEVGVKFQLYNGLFTSLPFSNIGNTGILLGTFAWMCEQGFKDGKSPEQIVSDFFASVHEEDKTGLLFKFIQYAERQVVLFDAIEEAAFDKVHDTDGAGTVDQLARFVEGEGLQARFEKVLQTFNVLLVLTAHPTQFYPHTVLGIINDLSAAIKANDIIAVQRYLQQLGQTPFLKKEKPSPYEEAINLVWYLEHVFYHAAGSLIAELYEKIRDLQAPANALLRMGFWPGGDRDGNPFVVTETTLQVAAALHRAILNCYYNNILELKKRLTFKEIEEVVAKVEAMLYNALYAENAVVDTAFITKEFEAIREKLIEEHNGLFVNMVQEFLVRLGVFGLHFATLDIRQDSSVHAEVLQEIMPQASLPLSPDNIFEAQQMDVSGLSSIAADTIKSMRAIKEIQHTNGEAGCYRYIISHCTSAANVWEVYTLLLISGWQPEELTVDIVPLFETVEDLRSSVTVMEALYSNAAYRAHLQRRGNKQTIMLGFSDGTKDGGYLMANWSIYKAKESLNALSEKYDIKVVFFDGRGGPPSRGGGKSHRFYAAHGSNIPNHEIQVTIQGQTISANFGNEVNARYNMAQFISAGIYKKLTDNREPTITEKQEALIQKMAERSYEKYIALKHHPRFMDYLQNASPMAYYADTNIGSRPARRSAGKLSLDSLRAIPYMASWSQLKQNVPGFYGVGSALKAMEEEGEFAQIEAMYRQSLFFRTLLDNCEMSMTKTFFPLTQHLKDHPEYGSFWQMIAEEFKLTKQYILKLANRHTLMGNYPSEKLSIQMREKIILPVSTIQQFAISMLNKETDDEAMDTWRKLIVRSSFGIINAARNSV